MNTFLQPLITDDHYTRMLRFELAQQRRLNIGRQQRYLVNRRYFYGEVGDPDNLKQPLGIRYIQTINQKHTHYLWGEWERDLVNWIVKIQDAEEPSQDEQDLASAIQRGIYRMTRRCDLARTLYKASLDGSIYGDSVLKLKWDLGLDAVNVESVLPEYFYAIWHPLETNETLECIVAFNMDRITAQTLYGTGGTGNYNPMGGMLSPHMAVVWEYYNAYEHILAVDGQIVKQEDNPFTKVMGDVVIPGTMPFIHIPNLGVNGEYWGFGDAEQIFLLADELNYRLADMGDVINYHAHPITLLESFYGNVDQLPVAADAVWDMGREGKASYLEWGGPPPQVMEYIDMLLRVMLETCSLTPVAFGQTTSSQASSAALNVQMMPVTEIVKRKRSFWTPALRELVLRMFQFEYLGLRAVGFKKRYGFDYDDLEKVEIQPKWFPILPRDRLQIVNEQVALLTQHARSLKYAMEEMGVDDPDLERDQALTDYKATLKIEAEINKELASFENNLNMKSADQDHQNTMEQTQLQMQQSQQEHKQTMQQDPTTDPERHQRYLEQVKTQGSENRKTMQTKAQTAERLAKVKRVSGQTGGKNSDKATGKSNTDGGE